MLELPRGICENACPSRYPLFESHSLALLEMLIEKRLDHRLKFRASDPVPSSGGNLKGRIHSGCLKRCEKGFSHTNRHGNVVLTLYDQERRIVLRDVTDRACRHRLRLILFERSAD